MKGKIYYNKDYVGDIEGNRIYLDKNLLSFDIEWEDEKEERSYLVCTIPKVTGRPLFFVCESFERAREKVANSINGQPGTIVSIVEIAGNLKILDILEPHVTVGGIHLVRDLDHNNLQLPKEKTKF